MTAEPTARPDQKKRLHIPPAAIAGTSYLALSVFAHLNAWTGGPGEKIQMGGGDLATYLWALRWVPYALTHGLNPFYSDFSNYPAGVNLLDNTSSFLLSVLVAPVTLAWGSIASYNLLQTLAFACSAFAAYLLLRRWTSWWPAAFLGGLLYGFSPFMVAAGWTHLFLIFAPAPPLIVLCLDELLVRQSRSAVRWGILLGLLVVAQFFISPEMLANMTEVSAIGVPLLILDRHRAVPSKFGHAATGLLAAIAVAAVALAYPIWFTLFGPQHVRVNVPAEGVSSNLLSPIVPNSNLVLTPDAVRTLGDSFSGPIAFMGRTYVIAGIEYLGLPLLLLLAYVLLRYWRLTMVWLFAVMTVFAFVASLGPVLHVGTLLTGIRLPGRVLTILPILDATVPYRYGLLVGLGTAVLLAVGLDRLHERLRQQSGGWRRLVLPAVGIAALAPLTPVFPYSVMSVRTPEYFRSTAASAIPEGSVVVIYPFPGPISAETMAWQAHNNFHYRMVGGYQNLPDGHGGFTHEGNPSVTRDYLNNLFFGKPAAPVTPALRQAIIGDLHDWDAGTIAVDLSVTGSDKAVALFTDVLGRPPQYQDGAAVWYRVPFGA